MNEVQAVFRKADINDVENIIKLCNECFNEETNLEYAKRIFQETMNDDKHIYLVGIMDQKVVAHVKITIIPTIYEEMNTYAIVNHVCVKPEYRRHNLATKMLDEVFAICKEKGCKKVELWSNNFRQAAHACYKNYGFVVEDAKFFSKSVLSKEVI